MARISKTKTLFFTTSPRSPLKMIPEIELLTNNYTGMEWNSDTQKDFMMNLIKQHSFENSMIPNDPAFSARDRINRAPKSLGFVDLYPTIKLTPAGEQFIKTDFKEEILLRQLLKFQLPSPYHTLDADNKELFFIKPYLEIIRLIHHFGSISFEELKLFGLQMRNYKDFYKIINEIEQFRIEKSENRGNYRKFISDKLVSIVKNIYSEDINNENFFTRESNENNIKNFIKTKARNMQDYADACFRYLRETGLFSISQLGKSISIIPEKKADIDFILNNVSRDPIFIDDEESYKKYLFDSSIPFLYSDNKDNLIFQMEQIGINVEKLQATSILELKKILKDKLNERKENIISEKINKIKNYDEYNNIMTMYDDILNKNVYDPSLMLEWNTWRAMTMIDGGSIKANLEFDDFGDPKSTALGRKADIICDYKNFGLTVEVTMQSGQRQYESEGEPVVRHLANYKSEINKDAYCLFIAPIINDSCIAYFYSLYKINISYYGGYSYVLPLELDVFIKMVQDSFKASYIPNPEQIEKLFKKSVEYAKESSNETDWYLKIKQFALHWLN